LRFAVQRVERRVKRGDVVHAVILYDGNR
jgi:hypothetical protein